MWFSLVIVTFLTIGIGSPLAEQHSAGIKKESVVVTGYTVVTCDTQKEIRDISSGSEARVQRGLSRLRRAADRSAPCRAEIISALMGAMDKPKLDFARDNNSYYLWLYGADLLGDLKAVEALDLLVSHLDQTSAFFSTSMNHQPALQGVIKMGSAAIPKLDYVLRHSSKASMRHSAVYCLATIGGPEVVRSLTEALATESDECIQHFIRGSLSSFDEQGHIKNRLTWFSSGSCATK